MDEPLYPSVQGQTVPDLGLAQYGGATPKTAISTNSDSTGPVMTGPPPLDDGDPYGDIHHMGIDPDVPYFHLELANDHEIMSPAQLTAAQGIGSVTGPTFSTPDMSVPPLKAGDLTGPGIDHVGEFEPDPHLDDLLDFARPGGLTTIAVWNTDPMAPDPPAPDLDEYDHPAGLGMPTPMTPDPTVPDLQQPQLEQEIPMADRPGDLASEAKGSMDDEEEKEQLPDGDYNEMWMQQQGKATRRTRHMGMLYKGLDDEEHDYR